jgi:hypothetical protein
MEKFRSISVDLVNNILFFSPSQICDDTGYHVVEIESTVSIANNADYSAKGESVRTVLNLSGKNISTKSQEYNKESQMVKWKPLLKKANVKTIDSFHSCALNFDVTLKEDGYTFRPYMYKRGGFSGIRAGKFVIPPDSTDEEIGRAVDRVLQYCIGKGGKRLEDFQKETPKPPVSDSEINPGKGISGFGFKTMWFAVKSQKPEKVAHALGVKTPREIEWDKGVDEAYKNSIFITPPIDGWVLAVGWGLFVEEMTKDNILSKAKDLSREFGEAQFFSTHRITEAHVWVKSVNGQIVRAYSYIGESGKNFFVEGEPTSIEQKYNLINTFSPEASNEIIGNKMI